MSFGRQSWTYEEAKEFFRQASEDEEWSWEKDTTWKDIRENPIAFLAILGQSVSLVSLMLTSNTSGTLALAFYFPSLVKYLNQQQTSRGRIPRDTILQKVKTSQHIPEESAKVPTQPSGGKSLGRNIRLKRKDLAQLLVDHLEEIILACSKVKADIPLEESDDTPLPSLSLQEIRAELEENESESFTHEELEHFCFQLKDQVRLLHFSFLIAFRTSSILTSCCFSPSSHQTLKFGLTSKVAFIMLLMSSIF